MKEAYIAAKFEKKKEVLTLYERLKEIGFVIAYDWTTHNSIKPYDQNQELAKQYAENEIEGIIKSDIFIYLADEKGTTLPMEFGAALMSCQLTGKPTVYVVGEFNSKSPWFFNSLVRRKDTVKEVVGELISSCK